MSLHLEAKDGDIAPTVLITGDPLRAKYIAETCLQRAVCYNRVRNMLGYTGEYQGQLISVQGTGIGIPSTALYLHELVQSYGVTTVIRVGTCGALQSSIAVGSVVLATSSYTDSPLPAIFNETPEIAPTPDPELESRCEHVARDRSITLLRGAVYSTDLFYSSDRHRYQDMTLQGILGIDMETCFLYAFAKANQVAALSLLTVSDNVITGANSSVHDREQKNQQTVTLALETVLRSYGRKGCLKLVN